MIVDERLYTTMTQIGTDTGEADDTGSENQRTILPRGEQPPIGCLLEERRHDGALPVRWFIKAEGGMGKTTMLRVLEAELMMQGIPVLFEEMRLLMDESHLTRFEKAVSDFAKETALLSENHECFLLLDSLDEYTRGGHKENRENALRNIIRNVLKINPRLSVILTSRYIPEKWNDRKWEIFTLNVLDSRQVSAVLSGINLSPASRHVLSTPMMVSIFKQLKDKHINPDTSVGLIRAYMYQTFVDKVYPTSLDRYDEEKLKIQFGNVLHEMVECHLRERKDLSKLGTDAFTAMQGSIILSINGVEILYTHQIYQDFISAYAAKEMLDTFEDEQTLSSFQKAYRYMCGEDLKSRSVCIPKHKKGITDRLSDLLFTHSDNVSIRYRKKRFYRYFSRNVRPLDIFEQERLSVYLGELYRTEGFSGETPTAISRMLNRAVRVRRIDAVINVLHCLIYILILGFITIGGQLQAARIAGTWMEAGVVLPVGVLFLIVLWYGSPYWLCLDDLLLSNITGWTFPNLYAISVYCTHSLYFSFEIKKMKKNRLINKRYFKSDTDEYDDYDDRKYYGDECTDIRNILRNIPIDDSFLMYPEYCRLLASCPEITFDDKMTVFPDIPLNPKHLMTSDTMESIPTDALHSFTRLETLYIGKSINELDGDTLRRIESLQTVTVSLDNPCFKSDSEGTVLYDMKSGEVIWEK